MVKDKIPPSEKIRKETEKIPISTYELTEIDRLRKERNLLVPKEETEKKQISKKRSFS